MTKTCMAPRMSGYFPSKNGELPVKYYLHINSGQSSRVGMSGWLSQMEILPHGHQKQGLLRKNLRGANVCFPVFLQAPGIMVLSDIAS